jgi:cytochrome bd-type quinol oxidase subunit 1
MEFPAWVVDYITAPMLIPLIAIPHVIVAMGAVGGGFLLAVLIRRAQRDRLDGALVLLRQQARVFILVTLVFGAVSGVGVWWTIGLTSPETTRALIHIFVFVWAAEWVAFLVEIVSIFALVHLWDRLAAREREGLAWIYAAAAWVSLVLITGITAFMLTIGGWWPGSGSLQAFLNPSSVPQILLRTGASLVLGALGLGGVLAFQPAAGPDRDRQLRAMARWALAGLGLAAVGAIGYALTMPEHARMLTVRAPFILTMLAAMAGSCLVLGAAFAAQAVTGARWASPPLALLLALVGSTAVTGGEFVREAARKPYRIMRLVYGPGVHPSQSATIQREGLVESTPWLKAFVRARAGRLTPAQRGEAIYSYHCAPCHAKMGYNGIIPLVRPWTPEMIGDAVRNLHRANPAMLPWLGNAEELRDLVDFLARYAEGTP